MLLREFTENDNTSTIEEGVLKDVVILGSTSRNKKRYNPEAMQRAVPLYEGMAVFADHPTSIDRDRKGRAAVDRFGVLRSPRFVSGPSGAQIRGDLHFLTTHPLSPRVAEDQKRELHFFGLSHLADGTGRLEKGSNMTVIESIDKVLEVDLVTNPATAISLREQEEAAVVAEPPAEKTKEELAAEESDRHEDDALESGVMAILKDPATSMEEKSAKIQALFAAHLKVHAVEEKPAEEKPEEKPVEPKDELKEQVATLSTTVTASITALTEQVKTLGADLAAVKKRKYLPGGTATDVTNLTLAEQQQSGGSVAADVYPENGTPAEKAAYLRRRSI